MKSKIIFSLFLLCTGIISNAQSRVVLTIRTGADDLAPRDFQKNLEVRIKIQGKQDVVLENANQGRGWSNNAIRSLILKLDPTTTIGEIKEIIVSRHNIGGWNDANSGIADNWNLQRLEATAYILKEGITSKYSLTKQEGNPYYRFIYGHSQKRDEGQSFSLPITLPVLMSSTNAAGTTITPTQPATPKVTDRTQHSPAVVVSPPSANKIDVDLKTGSDNLEMKPFQNNVQIRIILLNRPDIILENANNGENWPNNSVRRVTIGLPGNITATEIKEIHIYRNQKGGPKYVWELGDKDNWNLQSITAFATIKTNGIAKRHDFETIVSSRRGSPLYRFTYDASLSEYEGVVCKKSLILKTATWPSPVNGSVTPQNVMMEVLIGTGGDDLRGGNDNVDFILSFHSDPRKITIRNIFKKAKLPNFSQRSKTIEIPDSKAINIYDIKEVEIRHTGGGGMGADNWDVDKIKISVTKDGQAKVLVDAADAPIHRFTGVARGKTFIVPLSPELKQSLK